MEGINGENDEHDQQVPERPRIVPVPEICIGGHDDDEPDDETTNDDTPAPQDAPVGDDAPTAAEAAHDTGGSAGDDVTDASTQDETAADQTPAAPVTQLMDAMTGRERVSDHPENAFYNASNNFHERAMDAERRGEMTPEQQEDVTHHLAFKRMLQGKVLDASEVVAQDTLAEMTRPAYQERLARIGVSLEI